MSDANGTNTIAADAAAANPETPRKELTAREQELIGNLLGCLKAPIEVDYDKLAAAMGMGNPRSACNAWGVIKKKLGNPALLGTPAKEPKTPGTKTPRKRAAKAATEDDNEDGDFGTPTKKRKATATPKSRGKGKKAPEPKEEEDLDDGNVNVMGEADENGEA